MTPLGPQTILITGATDGHGKGLAVELVRRGARVLVHGRDMTREQRADPQPYDDQARRTLRALSERLTGLAPGG